MMLAKVPAARAAEAIPEMMRAGIVDRTAKISGADGFRMVPLLPGRAAEAEAMGFDAVEGGAPARGRTPPQERILAALSDLPEHVLRALPRRWEFVGDIAILKLDPSAGPHLGRIGGAYARELGVSTVCVDRGGVSGELRRPCMQVIHGTETESVRLENGIRYAFDVTKVMFASGNTGERERMERLDCAGETVVDMFAGIGYFTLPIAKFAGPARVVACEKNPESYAFLLKNIALNGVEGAVRPVLGDNRDLPGSHFADRVLMGYVQTTSQFLPKALDLLRPGGIIHYHDTFCVRGHEDRIRGIFDAACPGGYEMLGIREVKSFAPSVSHYVADVRVP